MQTRQQIHCSPAEKIRSKAFKKITAFILLIICVSCSHFANAQTTDFKFTVNTSLGTLPTQFIFPATGSTGGYSILWMAIQPLLLLRKPLL